MAPRLLPILIVICDLCMIGNDVCKAAADQVREKTGLPPNRILIAATHSHAVPRAIPIGTSPRDEAYHERLARQIAAAVAEATENLAPAAIGYTSFERPDLVACRRFLCDAGSVSPNPFGETDERLKSVAARSSAIIEPAGPRSAGRDLAPT